MGTVLYTCTRTRIILHCTIPGTQLCKFYKMMIREFRVVLHMCTSILCTVCINRVECGVWSVDTVLYYSGRISVAGGYTSTTESIVTFFRTVIYT